jgi:hypothetical protein
MNVRAYMVAKCPANLTDWLQIFSYISEVRGRKEKIGREMNECASVNGC